MPNNVGQVIGNLLRDVDELKGGVHDSGQLMTYMLGGIGVVTIVEDQVLVESRDYNASNLVLILGHSTRGVLGTNKLGTDASAFTAWNTIETLTTNQTLTDAGRNKVRDWIAGDSPIGISYIGFGSGTTAVATSDTALETEITRVATTNSKTDKKTTAQTTLNTLTTGTIAEVGTLNAATTGTLYSRRIITPITKTANNEVRITTDIVFSNVKPVMNAGSNEVRDWLTGDAATAPTHVAWGNGSTTTAITDTTLENELERNATLLTSKDTFAVNFESMLLTSEPAGQPVALTRSGLFNASTVGEMFMEFEHFSFTKTDRLEVQTQHKLFIR